MSRDGDTALAFLLGAAVGGIAALLIAPASGRETRARLTEKSEELYGKGRETAENLKGTAEERVRDVGDKARVRVDAVKEAVSEGRDAYQKELRRNASS